MQHYGGGRVAALAGVVAAGLWLDLGILGLRLPTTRRQVNEDWLGRYRGWVVGVGFGALVFVFRIRSFKEVIRAGRAEREAEAAARRGAAAPSPY